MDLLYRTGTLCRRPDGGVENVGDHKAAGMEWELLNVGGDVNRNPAVWDHQRALLKGVGIPLGPWMHCHSLDDVKWLVGVAVDWQADIVGVNVEDVVDDHIDLAAVGAYLLDAWVNRYGKPVHMPTLPWVQNSAGWQHVAFAYLALELFPEAGGQKYLDAYEACIEHAFNEGAERVTLLYSSQSPRSVYPAAVAHCIYTADNVGANWAPWHDTVPQVPPQPREEPPVPTVTPIPSSKFPYTGPCYGPGAKQTLNKPTVKGLKRAMIRLGFLDQVLGQETDDYGPALKAAVKAWETKIGMQLRDGNYGSDDYQHLRIAKVTSGPHKGEYAMDAKALAYVRQDAIMRCYPHPQGALSTVCQGLHPTLGIPGNWAEDFCAPGGTPVYAVEKAKITELSGRDPSLPPDNVAGIWGLSIHFVTGSGYHYFATHFGSRSVRVGQIVEVGQVIAHVGNWPGNPGRSHTHLGVSSPLGEADAKKHIGLIAAAPHLPLNV